MRRTEKIDLKSVVFSRKEIWCDKEHYQHTIKNMDSDYIKNCVHYIIRKRDTVVVQPLRVEVFRDYIYTFLCELSEREECIPYIEWIDGKPVVGYKEIDFVYLKI